MLATAVTMLEPMWAEICQYGSTVATMVPSRPSRPRKKPISSRAADAMAATLSLKLQPEDEEDEDEEEDEEHAGGCPDG
ncbi:hypothetical protein EYF80_060971 [Liparis tanakae]|uniref:Uncharacterized protein n=1 Tax=Liparis tanakae TaxID=230148 RepID=A0A4Z2EJX5_9TELE|nr:hypothetical protein EYF80_060971 [Liparis tanakae]